MTVKTKQHNNCGFYFLHSLTIQVKYVHIQLSDVTEMPYQICMIEMHL